MYHQSRSEIWSLCGLRTSQKPKCSHIAIKSGLLALVPETQIPALYDKDQLRHIDAYLEKALPKMCSDCCGSHAERYCPPGPKSKPAPPVLTKEHVYGSTSRSVLASADSGCGSIPSATAVRKGLLSEVKRSLQHILARDDLARKYPDPRLRFVRWIKNLLWKRCNFRARPYLREGSTKWKQLPAFYEDYERLEYQPEVRHFGLRSGRVGPNPTDFGETVPLRYGSSESSEGDESSESDEGSDAESDSMPWEGDYKSW